MSQRMMKQMRGLLLTAMKSYRKHLLTTRMSSSLSKCSLMLKNKEFSKSLLVFFFLKQNINHARGSCWMNPHSFYLASCDGRLSVGIGNRMHIMRIPGQI